MLAYRFVRLQDALVTWIAWRGTHTVEQHLRHCFRRALELPPVAHTAVLYGFEQHRITRRCMPKRGGGRKGGGGG